MTTTIHTTTNTTIHTTSVALHVAIANACLDQLDELLARATDLAAFDDVNPQQVRTIVMQAAWARDAARALWYGVSAGGDAAARDLLQDAFAVTLDNGRLVFPDAIPVRIQNALQSNFHGIATRCGGAETGIDRITSHALARTPDPEIAGRQSVDDAFLAVVLAVGSVQRGSA